MREIYIILLLVAFVALPRVCYPFRTKTTHLPKGSSVMCRNLRDRSKANTATKKDWYARTEDGERPGIRNLAIALLRDVGGIRSLADSLSVVLAAQFVAKEPSLVHRFFSMDLKSYAYGSRSDEQVHVFSYEKDNDVNDCEDCTVVFVHGGAWGSGKPWMYRLATEGICDAIPGASKGILIQYPVYPLATIFDQAECIIDAIEFVKSNARTLGMSKQTKFVLVGHSSGAHLSVLATIAASRKGRRLVDVVLGLSGVYDIGSHFDFEKNRGVHVISPMRSAALGPLNWDDCSPSLILQQYFEPAIGHQVDTSIIESEMSMGWPIRLFPKFFFLHGTRDATVPHSSTEKMEEVLAARGCDVHAIYADYEHIDPIVDLTMMDRNSTVSTALTQIRITSDELSTLNATSV